mgnify:CR=1 FL=1
MSTFRSCHLIASRKLADDRRHVHDFIDADFFSWAGISTLYLEWTPSTSANNFFSQLCSFGETLNIFPPLMIPPLQYQPIPYSL